MKTLLIADDLTGALDSSVAFVERGLTVLCALSPDHVSQALERDPDVICVSTNSRELAENEAIKLILSIVSTVDLYPAWCDAVVFKKIDSRLKGHIAAEVDVLADRCSGVLVCPAIPRLNRLVKNGRVCGAGVATPFSVSATIGLSDMQVVDAQTDGDLDAALTAVDLRTLFVGAAGLAEALARRLVPNFVPRSAPVLHAPALFAIGSRDPVTLAQLTGLTPIRAANGRVPTATPINQALSIVQMTPGKDAIEPARAGNCFAAGISNWVIRHNPASLLVCGGESAAAIAKYLGCGLLRVEGEVMPGLPVSTMIDGLAGLKVVTKSGGFGGPDTLVKLVDKLVK